MAVGELPMPSTSQEEDEHTFQPFLNPSSSNRDGSPFLFGSFKPTIPSNRLSSHLPTQSLTKPSYAEILKGSQPPFPEIVKGLPASTLADNLFLLRSKKGTDSKGLQESPIDGGCNGFVLLKPTSTYNGKPAVTFSNSDKISLIKRMKHILVAKFSHGRPSLATVKKFFASFNLKGFCNISVYDSKHLILECQAFEDYVKIWMSKQCMVGGFLMRFFKWREDFHPSIEAPICPVWVHIPGLPLYLYEEEVLMSIANAIGRPLALDLDNINRSKLGCATFCVEVDVSAEIIDKIWIDFEVVDSSAGRQGIWQNVIFDPFPPYCDGCAHLGHTSEHCLRLKNRSEGLQGLLQLASTSADHCLGESNDVLQGGQMLIATQDYTRGPGPVSKGATKELTVESASEHTGITAAESSNTMDNVEVDISVLKEGIEATVVEKLALDTLEEGEIIEHLKEGNMDDNEDHLGEGSVADCNRHDNIPLTHEGQALGTIQHLDRPAVLTVDAGNSAGFVPCAEAAPSAGTITEGELSRDDAGTIPEELGNAVDPSAGVGLNTTELVMEVPRVTHKAPQTGSAVPFILVPAGTNSAGFLAGKIAEMQESDKASGHDFGTAAGQRLGTNCSKSGADTSQTAGFLVTNAGLLLGENCCNSGAPSAEQATDVAVTAREQIARVSDFGGAVAEGDAGAVREYDTGQILQQLEKAQGISVEVELLEQLHQAGDFDVGADGTVLEAATGGKMGVLPTEAESHTTSLTPRKLSIGDAPAHSSAAGATETAGTDGKTAAKPAQEERQQKMMDWSTIEGFAMEEIEMLMASPTRIDPVFTITVPNLNNEAILDLEGTPVLCSEVIRKSSRIADVREHFKFLSNEKLVAEMVEEGKYEEFIMDAMKAYTKEIHRTFLEQEKSIYPKDSATEKVTPKASTMDEKEWTTPKRRGRNRNRPK